MYICTYVFWARFITCKVIDHVTAIDHVTTFCELKQKKKRIKPDSGPDYMANFLWVGGLTSSLRLMFAKYRTKLSILSPLSQRNLIVSVVFLKVEFWCIWILSVPYVDHLCLCIVQHCTAHNYCFFRCPFLQRGRRNFVITARAGISSRLLAQNFSPFGRVKSLWPAGENRAGIQPGLKLSSNNRKFIFISICQRGLAEISTRLARAEFSHVIGP